MPILDGTALNFGYIGTADANGNQGFTSTSLSGALLQSAKQTKTSEVEAARNSVGDTVTQGFYDIHDEATFEAIISGTSVANAITNTALLSPGSLVSITTCSSMPSMVGTWICQPGFEISGPNTGYKKFTLPIRKYPNVNALASGGSF